MNILIIGTESNFQECSANLKNGNQFFWHSSHAVAEADLDKANLVIDFNADDPEKLRLYQGTAASVLVNTSFNTLREVLAGDLRKRGNIFGFNGMPGFLSHDCLEVSVLHEEEKPALSKLCDEISMDYVIIEDRVGMVTPRIICMIINEAYYTVQEKTAGKADIDLAMKLGTGYPFGPFEWCDKIGVRNVYDLLTALYNDTHDERYKISPLLKQEYLNATRSPY